MKNLKYIALISIALMAVNPVRNLLISNGVNLVWAEISTSTLIEVQEDTQNLIKAKDQENPTPEEEQKLRLEIFTKVINLSLKEVEDIINQLNALKNLNEPETALLDQLLEKFNGFLQFYNEQKENLAPTAELDLATIKKLAQDFKDWRENTYLPIFDTATDFLLINQQKAILEMTEKRYQKISLDVAKLKKANLKGIDQLEKYLNQAADLIEAAKTIWQETQDNFWQVTTATSTATSTIASVATSTATSSAVTTEENQPLSIKNLIRDSLNKIKEAYRIFIEMSNLVRKLLL
jgi:hypothetical protein